MTHRDLHALLGEAEGEIGRTGLPTEIDRRLRQRLFPRAEGEHAC